jgi:hypothetical protein
VSKGFCTHKNLPLLVNDKIDKPALRKKAKKIPEEQWSGGAAMEPLNPEKGKSQSLDWKCRC